MTQVFGDLNKLGFGNLSVEEESESEDDEVRQHEIKKYLTEELGNATFDEDESQPGDSFFKSPNSQQNSFLYDDKEKNGNGWPINGSNGLPLTNGNGVKKGILKNSNYGQDSEIHRLLNGGNGIENGEVRGNGHTVSLIHKNHCPQNEDDGLSSEIWRAAESNNEQLKTLCEFRERQTLRLEETIAGMTKEKRVLNHQIGLMKTEMVQLKGVVEDKDKTIFIRDQEILYLKEKLTEGINEYEATRKEIAEANNEISHYKVEIEQLEQKVKLLSSIGSSTEKDNVNQIVRQIREKHAKEMNAWKNMTADLESQIEILKKPQRNADKEIYPRVSKDNRSSQTEILPRINVSTSYEPEIDWEEHELKESAKKEFFEEIGCGDIFAQSVPQPIKETKDAEVNSSFTSPTDENWETEKNRLIEYFNKEIEGYQEKLKNLPSQLFAKWNENQEKIRKRQIKLEMVVEQNQTKDEKLAEPSKIEGMLVETRSTIVQTEETLETFKILAALIDQWAIEVAESTKKAEDAESALKISEEEMKTLKKKFKSVQKMAYECRREWKKRETEMVKMHENSKAHFVEMLSHLYNRLEPFDSIQELNEKGVSY